MTVKPNNHNPIITFMQYVQVLCHNNDLFVVASRNKRKWNYMALSVCVAAVKSRPVLRP